MNETNKKLVITYTWCECGENHTGNQQIGQIADVGDGYNLDDLKNAQKYAKDNYNCKTKIYNLNKLGFVDDKGKQLIIKNNNGDIVKPPKAHFLIIKDFINVILKKNGYTHNDLIKEVLKNKWDSKYFDVRRQKVLNKHARKNNVISTFSQKADYLQGKGSVHSFQKMPIMNILRDEFNNLGDKFKNFPCSEGNLYEDGGSKENGIGWHGDSERRRVLAMRLGFTKKSMPFYYRWYYDSKNIGKTIEIPINNGDVMIMSEHAVGTNWKHRSLITLRHATGANKFIK